MTSTLSVLFAVNSIDYLLKPIHQERLLQTIERFESLTEKYIRDFNRESRILEVLESLSDTQKLPVVENKKISHPISYFFR